MALGLDPAQGQIVRALKDANQRADWAVRPTPYNQLLYAALDPHYLLDVMRIQVLRLQGDGIDIQRVREVLERSYHVSQTLGGDDDRIKDTVTMRVQRSSTFNQYQLDNVLWTEQHTAIFNELKQVRYQLAVEQQVHVNEIASLEFLASIALHRPNGELEMQASSYYDPDDDESHRIWTHFLAVLRRME